MVRPEPRDTERPFHLHELFFSTTDERGVIVHGNKVFVRVSGYAEEQLIGAPHSIVRHPDMPRCVFQLLWDTIRSQQTIVAYVKNLASDGSYYWVLAVVTPFPGGYLSIRLKPSAPLFQQVKGLYGELLKTEREIEQRGVKERAMAIVASTSLLQQAVKRLGFADYQSFMAHALQTELEHRWKGVESHNSVASIPFQLRNSLSYTAWEHTRYLEQALQQASQQLGEFRKTNHVLMSQSDSILMTAESIDTLSMNARISSNLQGVQGATLQVIAHALGEVSTEIQAITDEFISQAKRAAKTLDNLAFDIATAILQIQVCRQFLEEILLDQGGILNEQTQQSLRIVLAEITQRTAAVFSGLQEAEKTLRSLHGQVERLARNNRRLLFVQFAGKKEAVQQRGAVNFSVVFEQVREQITGTMGSCTILEETVLDLRTRLAKLYAQKGPIQECLTEFNDCLLSQSGNASRPMVAISNEPGRHLTLAGSFAKVC